MTVFAISNIQFSQVWDVCTSGTWEGQISFYFIGDVNLYTQIQIISNLLLTVFH